MISKSNLGKAKNNKAFESLFKEHYPFLCSFAQKYVNDLDACKDIVHNVFLNLWQKQDELHTDTSLKAYLFKSVYNRCLNYIRDNKKIVHHDVLLDNQTPESYIESADYLEQSELEMKIKKSVDELPDSCKQVFMMSRFEEKKYKEIATELNISIKTVEAQMSKSLKILREKLALYLKVLLILITIAIGS